jgi:hypothetical protein
MIVEYRTEYCTIKGLEGSLCYTRISHHSLIMELKNSQYLYRNKYLRCGLLLHDSQQTSGKNIEHVDTVC